MEKLTLCSKVLYDIDMVDKVNKIVQLETDLNGLPPMLFNSYSEFVFKFNAIQNFYNVRTKDSYLFLKPCKKSKIH